MGTKTITASITLHVAGKTYKPFKFSDTGIATEGKYDVVHAAPGTPVVLDEHEADSLIERGVAKEYAEMAPTAAPVPIEAPAKK